MNPLSLLNTAIDTLWYWTYGIIVGWGASFTILTALFIVLFIRTIRLTHRLNSLNNRLIALDREVSITLNKLNK
jgi:hypothetical protein